MKIREVVRLPLKLLISLALTWLFLELGLRLFPGAIPLDLLVLFDEQPRTEIARRQGLATEADTILLTRDDGGPELRIPKPSTRFRFRPDNEATIQVTMDETGFCNPQGSYQQPAIDIITLGDSFTACHAVHLEDVWTAQLGRLTGYTTYNLGRSGTGIQEYLQLLKQFGLQKSPRLVIMNVYEGNDLRDVRKYYHYRQGRIDDEPESSQDSSFLGRYSYAANLISALAGYGYALYPQLVDAPLEQSKNYNYRLVFSDGMSIPFHELNTEEAKQARELRAKEVEIGVQLALEEALKRFADLGKKHDFIPVVTYIPAASTAYEVNVVYENPEFSELIPWFSREQRSFFSRQAERFGYIFIDLTPAIQAAAQSYGPHHLLYYQHDIHLTPTGHAVVAEALHQELRTLAIIGETRQTSFINPAD